MFVNYAPAWSRPQIVQKKFNLSKSGKAIQEPSFTTCIGLSKGKKITGHDFTIVLVFAVISSVIPN